MKVSFSKKQSIILIVLLTVVLTVAAGTVAAVLLCRPEPITDPPEPDESLTQNEWNIESHASPTEAPAPEAIFTADVSRPMPEEGAVLPLGEAYALGGTVYCNYPMSAVTVTVTCAHNSRDRYPYKRSVKFTGTGPKVYALTDAPAEGETALCDLIDFSEFAVGYHTLTVSVSCKGMRSAEVFRTRFYVVGPDWETIKKENFPDSYPEALAFFGDTERFLYRYQWVNGRYILADPDWEKTYITLIPAYPNGEPWLMHVDAVAYFEKAFAYLESSYLRVHGPDTDTGVIRASSLITEYNGCYVSRFTSSLKAISHHTFGTAVDVNASMIPNKNDPANTALIDDDVKTHLVYNGILEENGVAYYDFTYDGTYETDPNGVPQTCVNYLLYELGFYRAGFGWAHYYKATSDAMHFCLSEFVTYTHDGVMGLRKVFAYADETPDASPAETPDETSAASPDGTPSTATDGTPSTAPSASPDENANN